MNPLSVNAASSPPVASPYASQSEAQSKEQALNVAVLRAARVLNQAGYAGAGREISFSLDPLTRQPVIEVLDTQTNKVLFQWPSAYVLELAAEQARQKDE